jgi:AraC-like DNA-binding protein
MSVLAQSVGNLWRVIQASGLDPQPFFDAEGLDLSWPIEPGTRVPYPQIDAIRSAAAAASGDPAFGLIAARTLHPSHLGALGYAVLASETLRRSLERIHRYVRVLNEKGHFDLREEEGLLWARIAVDEESANVAVRDDAQMATLMSLCSINAGPDFKPAQVCFRHSAPADPGPWADTFFCQVHFSREHNEMAFSLSDADRMLPSANPVLAEMNERVVVQRLARLDRDNIPDRVRGFIMEQLPSGEVSDERVAEVLHMTPRTLHRRLKEDGHSFRSLLKDVRQDLARQYVADDSLTLTEITFLLGFSEMSSFSRAYKNWYGEAPSEARRQG